SFMPYIWSWHEFSAGPCTGYIRGPEPGTSDDRQYSCQNSNTGHKADTNRILRVKRPIFVPSPAPIGDKLQTKPAPPSSIVHRPSSIVHRLPSGNRPSS